MPDFQAILLSFFGQELVAHAATLFAALGGEFLFMGSFYPQMGASFWSRLGFGLVSGFLIALVVYAGFRMVSYGQLAYVVMTYDPRPEHLGLSQYYAHVIQTASSRETRAILRYAAVFRYPTNSPYPLLVVGIVWLGWILCLFIFS